MTAPIRIPAETVRAFLSQLFQRFDLPAQDAQTAADVLLLADLRGVDSHGINNLDQYVEPLASGQANPRPNIAVVRQSPVSAVVDGDGGLGLVVGVRAMELCIARAQAHGLAAVTVRRSKHYGIASYYAMMCLPHNMIGLSLTNNSGPGVVPTFGKQAMLSSNPISMAVPAGDEPPFVMDFATSVVAMSKVSLAKARGETRIPIGWALDRDGRPTDDVDEVLKAWKFLPLGGTHELGSHKGYGLGVAVDILTGVLSGNVYNTLAQRDPPSDEKRRFSSAHFFAALRVDLFRPLEEFQADMDDMLRALKDSEKAEGQERIYTHGEIEFETEAERRQKGIPYPPALVERLRALAAQYALPLEV